mmetsp:Transcript_4465/g.6631  ORF Transcript_4465/g.6631 Transcript_4465/m.6631 type:complete len:213 (+) Transcript_4465:2625-3263(+)
MIILPQSVFSKMWHTINLLFCAISAVLYPYVTAFGFPHLFHPITVCIIATETVMLFDIVFNFLTAFEDEGSMEMVMVHSKIARRYIFHGRFLQDVIIWLPIGQLLMLANPTLAIFLLIKTYRFEQLIMFMDRKKVMPIFRSYFDSKTQKILKNPYLSEDKINDHNQIFSRLIASSVYNIVQLFTIIWIIVYVVAMMWCILLNYERNYWKDES